MTTGTPGSAAAVNNSGTEQDAVLDFTIPQGADGGGGAPQVLAAVSDTAQNSTAGAPLIFRITAFVSGSALSHTAGASEILVRQPGVYQASFQGSVLASSGAALPATADVRLYLNGVQVPGAIARHTFTAASNEASLSFDVPFSVPVSTGTLTVLVNEAGFTFPQISLSIHRLGDAAT